MNAADIELIKSLPTILFEPPAGLSQAEWHGRCRLPNWPINGMPARGTPPLPNSPVTFYRGGLVAQILALRETETVSLARHTIPVLPARLRASDFTGIPEPGILTALLETFAARNQTPASLDNTGIAEALGVQLVDAFVLPWYIKVGAWSSGWFRSGVSRRRIQRYLPDLRPFVNPNERLLKPCRAPRPSFAISLPAFAGDYCMIRIDSLLLGRIIDSHYKLLRKGEDGWVGIRASTPDLWI